MRIARLTDHRQLQDLYAFRYHIYVDELHWLDPTDSPEETTCNANALESGILTDHFDATALNYAAFDEEGEVVGSMQVVLDGSLGLPLEECWTLDGFRTNRHVAELCRLAVADDRRMTRLPLLLMKAGWQGARRKGVDHVLVDAFVGEDHGAHANRLYERLGFEPLGSPCPDVRYCVENPMVVLAIECVAGEEALSPHLRGFFQSSDSMIDHGE